MEVGESDLVTTRSMTRPGNKKQISEYWTRTRTGDGDESSGIQTGGKSVMEVDSD